VKDPATKLYDAASRIADLTTIFSIAKRDAGLAPA